MAREIDSEFDRELVRAAVKGQFLRLGYLSARAGIPDLHAYIDELAGRDAIDIGDVPLAHAGIDARKRMSRSVGWAIALVACVMIIWYWRSSGVWGVLALLGPAVAGGLAFSRVREQRVAATRTQRRTLLR